MSAPWQSWLASLPTPPRSATLDSRHIRPGDLFIAVPGAQADGRNYIKEALARGACGVLWAAEGFSWPAAEMSPNLGVLALERQLGDIANTLYDNPSHALTVIGITGTNGKTSTSHWLQHAFNTLGHPTAVLGTVGNGFAGQLAEAINTTPDAVTVQHLLSQYRQQGAQTVAMEVSSHALEQGRVAGVRFSTALFTNLTRDHLDYHGTLAAYGAAKARLFTWPGLKHAVINIDDAFGVQLAELARRAGVEVITYGETTGDIHTLALTLDLTGTQLRIRTPIGQADLHTHVIGRFNVANLLGVLGVLLAEDIPLTDAVEALQQVRSVAGRMQLLGGGHHPTLVIDYAHTPDALEKALRTLRDVMPAEATLSCVMGCGGNRDTGKRPMMGEIAARLADYTLITNDNPRNEAPQAIADAIASGMTGAQFEIELDRERAIHTAIGRANAGDVVLIAGKGHEDYQLIGTQKLAFSDLHVAEAALSRRQQGGLT